MNNILILIKKELLVILKDPKSRAVLIIPIIIQTIIFGYVATFDINKIPYAVYDKDRTEYSQKLISMFDSTGTFRHKYNINSIDEMKDLINNKKVAMVLHFTDDFESSVIKGQIGEVQAIIDSRNSNTANVIAGYAIEIINKFNGVSLPIASIAWYNPNLETRWNMITAIVATLAMMQLIMLTAFSVSKERELGTFDQLLVTPLSTKEILLGKAAPSMVIGLLQSTIVLIIARFWFKIPFSGSLLIMYFGLFVFITAIVGVGLFVSAVAKNMQQGMLFSFVLIMPMILLSGMATPIKNMPDLLQTATYLNPLRHGINITRKVYLEGADILHLKTELIALVLIAAVLLPFASNLFRKRI